MSQESQSQDESIKKHGDPFSPVAEPRSENDIETKSVGEEPADRPYPREVSGDDVDDASTADRVIEHGKQMGF